MKRLALSVAVVCLATARTMSAENPGSNFIILAIMGQSNASGYSFCPAELPPVADGIYNFGNDYQLRPAQEPIDNGLNQIDMVSYDEVSRCGSSIAIATELQRITGRNVVIVPCAKGGSFMASWLPSYSRDTLYGSCLNRIQTVDAGGNHTVMIFYYQGESDAGWNMDEVNAWDGRFTRMVDALNTDLNYPPIVFAQVGKTSNPAVFPYMLELANKQAEIFIPNVMMVKSEDLALDGYVHLDYASQQIIGERAAIALYWLMKQK